MLLERGSRVCAAAHGLWGKRGEGLPVCLPRSACRVSASPPAALSRDHHPLSHLLAEGRAPGGLPCVVTRCLSRRRPSSLARQGEPALTRSLLCGIASAPLAIIFLLPPQAGFQAKQKRPTRPQFAEKLSKDRKERRPSVTATGSLEKPPGKDAHSATTRL